MCIPNIDAPTMWIQVGTDTVWGVGTIPKMEPELIYQPTSSSGNRETISVRTGLVVCNIPQRISCLGDGDDDDDDDDADGGGHGDTDDDNNNNYYDGDGADADGDGDDDDDGNDDDDDEGGDDEYHREGILRGVLGRSWGPLGAFWSCLRPL